MSEPLDLSRPESFDTLLTVMRRLRDPVAGCPWDLQQTHQSLRNTLLEEVYEAVEALDSDDTAAMVEELGDLMFQPIFHAQIAADAGRFTMNDVVRHLTEKLVRRHPHVFGDSQASSAKEALGHWESLKAREREAKGQADRSMLDGVPKSMPALAYAQAVADRAMRAGFDFESDRDALDKLAEEVAEVRDAQSPQRREEELGDVLFMVTVAAARMGVDAEAALRGANRRFSSSFRHMELSLRAQGQTLSSLDAQTKRALWHRAKESEG